MGKGTALAATIVVLALLFLALYTAPQLLPKNVLPPELERMVYNVSSILHKLIEKATGIPQPLQPTPTITVPPSMPTETATSPQTPATTSPSPTRTQTVRPAQELEKARLLIDDAKKAVDELRNAIKVLEDEGLRYVADVWRGVASEAGSDLMRASGMLLSDPEKAIQIAKAVKDRVGDVRSYLEFVIEAAKVLSRAEAIDRNYSHLLDDLKGVIEAVNFYREAQFALTSVRLHEVKIAQSILNYPPVTFDLTAILKALDEAESRLKRVASSVTALAVRMKSTLTSKLERLEHSIASARAELSSMPPPRGLAAYASTLLDHASKALQLLKAEVYAGGVQSPSRLAVLAKALQLVEHDVSFVKTIIGGWENYVQGPQATYSPGRGLILTLPGTIDAIAFYPEGSSKPVLKVWTYRVKEEVMATEVTVTPFYTQIIISDKLLKSLSNGRYTVIAFSPAGGGKLVESYRLEIEVTGSGLEITKPPSGSPHYAPCSSSDPYRVALLCSATGSQAAIVIIKALSYMPSSGVDAAWNLLEFMGSRISYDTDRASKPVTSIYSPLELIETGRGICSDYALLAVTALEGLGYTTLLLVMPSINHAVALLEEKAGIVLDQHPPPILLVDYIEHVAPELGNSRVDVYRVYLRLVPPTVRVLLDVELSKLPGYQQHPPTMPLAKAMVTVQASAAKSLAMAECPYLAAVAQHNVAYVESKPKLTWYVGSRSVKAELMAFYRPGFGWETHILEKMVKELAKQGFPEAVAAHGSLAAVALGGGIRVYAAPLACIKPEVEVTRTAITVRVGTVASVQVTLNALNGTILLAIAKPGYRYEEIPYVTAEKWKCSVSTGCTIVIPVPEVVEKLGPGTYTLVVWVNKHPVYAETITLTG